MIPLFSALLPPLIVGESEVHPHVAGECPHLFTAIDGASTEVEYLELLRTFIKILKPKRVIETGTFHGWGTLAIATALAENGPDGKVFSVERDTNTAHEASMMLLQKGVNNVEIVCTDSLRYIESLDPEDVLPFDFGFFDSDLSTRFDEFSLLRRRGLLIGTAAFHDTSRLRCMSEMGEIPEMSNQYLINHLDAYVRAHHVHEIEFPWSRGLRLLCNLKSDHEV